ncbi:hypothetical protein C1645_821926 [Glomus cerebriforme]|uniref:Kelch-like protein 17 n=1 Tax=Glomus cerebriforme TaxID=658196 RepID=A0A397T5C4_9GLOM|nr:hypothetical protein C1645_821926 [Glomus cerebriforme]
MDDKFLLKLSQNLLEILDDDEYYDITIEVGNDPYVRIFHAHMVILNYRSPYLRKILSTNKKKSDGSLVHIKLPNILPEIFQIILRYIYGGRLSLEKYDTLDIIKTLVAASELNLQELVSHIQTSMIENHKTWLEQNFNLIYQTSFENDNDTFLELQKFCTELISKEPDKIFNSINFSSIPEKILVSLIQNDNLQMDVVQVWQHVIKWGLNHHPELPSDPASFTNDDFSLLKNTLQQCIPLIKFDAMSSKEFLDSVFPYREILSEELFLSLLKLFLDHDYKPTEQSEPEEVKEIKPEAQLFEDINTTRSTNSTNSADAANSANSTRATDDTSIDSRIITFQHFKLISKWINRFDVNASYEFKLILRGSRDGFTPIVFHEICDNRSHTLTIIKVKDSNEILGGYNPLEWKSDGTYGDTNDSFIFSFKNNQTIENHILSRVNQNMFATSNYYNRGPSFGKGYKGKGDLIVRGSQGFNNCLCENNSYETCIRNNSKFSVEEYEVFQITNI